MRQRRSDRYDLTEARDLGQRGEPVKHARKVGNVEAATVAVANPLWNVAAGGRHKPAPERVRATVNRRVDVLEYEHSHGRISAAAYNEGRVIQALFERAGISGGSTWRDGSRIDAVVAKELMLSRRCRDARLIAARMAKIGAVLGQKSIDVAIIRQVLGENRRYADVALPARLHTDTRSGIAYVAARFRDALETLARESRRR